MRASATLEKLGKPDKPSIAKLILAFASIYFIWGSTYVAIRYAIQTLPGFLMAAVRFLVAGGILCAVAYWQGARLSGRTAWRRALSTGFILLLLGHGTVVLAIHWVPSGLAALLLCTTPIWVALMEWVLPGGKRPDGRVSTGILLGFLGIVMLVGIGDVRNDEVDLLGAVLLLLSSVAWSAGTIYSRRAPVSDSPLMTSGMQMLTGGGWLFLASVLNGDLSRFHVDTISVQSVLAFGYLTFFGSIIAFTAYSWIIKVASPARAVTSSYVNPVVAVLLGHALAGEPLSYRMMLAMLTIILGVIVITSAKTALDVSVKIRETADEAV
jgi:drug/metabolite transporter (DMT)-like permease